MSRRVTHHDHILPYSNPNLPFSWTYNFNHKTNINFIIVPTDYKHQTSSPIVHDDVEHTLPPNDVEFQQDVIFEPTPQP